MGDAFKMIGKLKHEVCDLDNDVAVTQEAAKLLHRDEKSCKVDQLTKSQHGGDFFNISHAQTASMIPCKMFNFSAALLCGKDFPVGHGGKVCCDDELEKFHLSQHIVKVAVLRHTDAVHYRNYCYIIL